MRQAQTLCRLHLSYTIHLPAINSLGLCNLCKIGNIDPGFQSKCPLHVESPEVLPCQFAGVPASRSNAASMIAAFTEYVRFKGFAMIHASQTGPPGFPDGPVCASQIFLLSVQTSIRYVLPFSYRPLIRYCSLLVYWSENANTLLLSPLVPAPAMYSLYLFMIAFA